VSIEIKLAIIFIIKRMSYESSNYLDKSVRLNDIIDFVKLLNYKHQKTWDSDGLKKIRDFFWFEEKNYKSISGVELSIFYSEENLIVTTRSTINRSYYDLEQQNKTIRLLKKYFGGYFKTDYGRGKYLSLKETPLLEQAAIGCLLAFNNFGFNLIRLRLYFDSRNFGNRSLISSDIDWLAPFNQQSLSNSFVLVFLVSILEEFWKSIYVALLKYSENKETILKNGRLTGDRLIQVSNETISVEQAFADSISFARISNVCSHFRALDKKYDFGSVLKKPYKRRKKNMFDTLEEMTEIRNTIIHEAGKNIIIKDRYIKELINNLHDSIERCYIYLTSKNNWPYDKTWSTGRLK
jgi:hypothetical protein